GGIDGIVKLWTPAGEPRGVLRGHRAGITHVLFTPAADRVVSTSGDGTARLWTSSGMLLGELAGHTNLVIRAALRADGRRLATASWDHAAMVWDLEHATELRPLLAAHDARAPLVTFAPDGGRVALGRAGGELSVVEVKTGHQACATEPAAAI